MVMYIKSMFSVIYLQLFSVPYPFAVDLILGAWVFLPESVKLQMKFSERYEALQANGHSDAAIPEQRAAIGIV